MKTILTLVLTMIVVCCCLETGRAAADDSLAARYAALESKFLLLIETSSARNAEENAVASQVLTESRRRAIVTRLKSLALALRDNRLAEAAVLFQTLENDLDAVEQLLSGMTATKGESKSNDDNPESGPDVPNSLRHKTDANKDRNESVRANQKRLAFQLMFRLKELRRTQSDIHAWIGKKGSHAHTIEVAGQTTATDEMKQMSGIESAVAAEAIRLTDVAVRDKFDSFLTAWIKGVGVDAGELAKLLASGERRDDWLMLSNLILTGLKSAIDKLEKSLETDSATDEKGPAPMPQPNTDPQSGSPEDYIPSLDELIMIRQLQERIAKRIEMCEQWGKLHPEKSRELERALHDLAQEQENLVEILRGK